MPLDVTELAFHCKRSCRGEYEDVWRELKDKKEDDWVRRRNWLEIGSLGAKFLHVKRCPLVFSPVFSLGEEQG